MKRRFSVFGAAIVLATAAAASADPIPITIVTQGGAARAGGSVNDSSGSDSDFATDAGGSPMTATAFASTALSSAASNATLTAQFGTMSNWFGFGTANSVISTVGTGTFFADSRFGVVFDVLAPLGYAFSGNFDAASSPSSPTGPNRAAATWEFELSREGMAAAVFSDRGTGPATRAFTGVLEPARYILSLGTMEEAELITGRAGFGRGSFSFTFDMTPADASPVPEPTSLLLLGTGLAGVFGWRKRAGNRSEPRR